MEEVQILSCKKYVKSIIAGNIQYMHSRKCISQPQNVIAYNFLRHNPNDYSLTGFVGHSISVQLTYQHGSAIPDTFSMLPERDFFLRCNFQICSILKRRNCSLATCIRLFFVSSASRIRKVFLLPYPSPRLCRSTSETPLRR